MITLFISNRLKSKEIDDCTFWPWHEYKLPEGFETTDVLILDFTGIDGPGHYLEVYNELYTEIPELLERKKITVICICSVKNITIDIPDRYDKKDEKDFKTDYPRQNFNPPEFKIYNLFSFLSGIKFKHFLAPVESKCLNTCPSEIKGYFKEKINDKAVIYFDCNGQVVERIGERKNSAEKELTSFRIKYNKGELIFLPGYKQELHTNKIVSAVNRILDIQSMPDWFYSFLVEDLPQQYFKAENQQNHIKSVCKMVYMKDDHSIQSRDSTIENNEHLEGKIREALYDIFIPINGKVIKSTDEQNGQGIDIIVNFEDTEILIQVKGADKKINFKKFEPIKKIKQIYPEKIALFLVNGNILKPYRERLEMPICEHLAENIVNKDYGVIIITVVDFYRIWKSIIDGQLDRRKFIHTIIKLNESTNKVFKYSDYFEIKI